MSSVLVLCGSLRPASFTRKALEVAAEAAQKSGCNVTWGDLRLPLMEEGTTETEPSVQAFRAAVRTTDALLVGTPVYHDSVSGTLKNAIDHLYGELSEKVVGVLAVGGGRAGQGQALEHLRASFRETSAWVLPRQVVIPAAKSAFDEAGVLKEPELVQRLQVLGTELALRCRQLRPKRPAPVTGTAR